MRHPIAAALILALFATPALGHGGQYKGPSDAGGPSANGGGQAAPPTNPGGAAAPGPGAPASGAAPTGPQTGGGRGKGNVQQTGGPVIDDGASYEIWEFWWENNKDQYLNLKNRLTKVTSASGSSTVLTGKGRPVEARSSRRASDQQIVTEVIPTLVKLLTATDNRDILDSDVLALGRTAREEQADAVLAAAQPLLAHRELSVQTSAALSMGVLDSVKSIAILTELMANTSRGQQLSGGGDVPWLSRAFSALSLGIINDPNSVDQLISIIKNSPDSDKDIKVCAVVALGLMDNNKVSDAYDFLISKLEDRKLDAVIKSYIPTALGKMAGGSRIEAVPALVKAFTDKDTDNFVRQSCAIGLGLLARLQQDGDAVKALHQYIAEGKDMQTRHFCFIALAEIGKRDKDSEVEHPDQHEALRDLFMRELSKPSTKTNRSWAALAGAIYAKEIAAAQPDIIAALEKAYDKESDPSFKAAFALSLGLLNDSTMGAKLHQDFRESKEEDFRGYAAVALGFMQYTQVAEDLRELCKSKTIGPTFRLQVATGLGLMGDTEAVSVLIDTLRAAETLGVSSAVAKALGLIGDVAAIGPLKDIANDEKIQPITRAFACVALGIVCEKTDLPWNARISADNNYRARVPAIDEVLDIL